MGMIGIIGRSTLFALYFTALTVAMGMVALPIRWFAPHRALGYAKCWAGLSWSICRRAGQC
jgi:hypothetical protein